ncbi:FAD-dependent oxidoreductase [Nocardia sp. NPDC058379]|uniref:FAD-dependent oxidoreductase n=1 Tax=unclassified Nocardia TaxID=2637762 RepID=UPI00366807B1
MPSEPLRVAIVGSGPSGFYAAAELIKKLGPDVWVCMIDRLPTPFGLVRSGVAPDHPKIKSVTSLFTRTAAHPCFHFLGGVEIGRDITHDELRGFFNAVVYATGAAADRGLEIPGTGLDGCFGGSDFVRWYNGHPDQRLLPVDLEVERAVVVGNGNVALDIARILTTPVAELERTDIAEHALDALSRSRIREVVVLGRRGPAQAAWTSPELIELGKLADVDVTVQGMDDPAALVPEANAANANSVESNVQIVRELADRGVSGAAKSIRLKFCSVPTAFSGEECVRAVVAADTRLSVGADRRVRAELTGVVETIAAGLVVTAVGHRSEAPFGVPLDGRGTIRNQAGRVIDGDRPVAGVYVAGWAKRGASGVIGTNKLCAVGTVRALLEDLESGILPRNRTVPADFDDLCRRRAAADYTDWMGWQRIDEFEVSAGLAVTRPRLKLTDLADMRAHARAASSE